MDGIVKRIVDEKRIWYQCIVTAGHHLGRLYWISPDKNIIPKYEKAYNKQLNN